MFLLGCVLLGNPHSKSKGLLASWLRRLLHRRAWRSQLRPCSRQRESRPTRSCPTPWQSSPNWCPRTTLRCSSSLRWPEVRFPQEGGTIPDAGALFGEEVTGRALLCQLQPRIDYLLRPKLWVEVAGEFMTSVGDIVIGKIELTTTETPQTPVRLFLQNPAPELTFLSPR